MELQRLTGRPAKWQCIIMAKPPPLNGPTHAPRPNASVFLVPSVMEIVAISLLVPQAQIPPRRYVAYGP